MSKFKLRENDTESLIDKFNNSVGLPKIKYETACFCTMFDRDDVEIHITLSNSNMELKFLNKNFSTDKKIREYLTTNSGNSLLNFSQLINQIGFSKCSVGKSTLLEYFFINNTQKHSVNIRIGSLIGTFLECEEKTLSVLKDHFGVNMGDYALEVIESGTSDKIQMNEVLISKGVLLNKLLIEHSNIFNIDLLNSQKTLQETVMSKSNDYSILEKLFFKVTKKDFISDYVDIKVLPSVSIIIPTFNSFSSLELVINNLAKQDFLICNSGKLEVIIIDDGSVEPVSSKIESKIIHSRLNLKIIRLEKNLGLSNARNIGSSIAKGELIIFLDSDILLPKNYVSVHAERHSCFDNIVTFSLKKNIDLNDKEPELAKYEEIPFDFDDFRAVRWVEKDKPGLYSLKNSLETSILNETDNLKKMGHGRVIGVYDLPAMVVGHNLCIGKKTLEKISGFSSDFVGWGMEDSYFGLNCIKNNIFIVPILASGVYHINHPARSGSDTRKNAEFKKNLKIYKNKLLE